MGHFDFIRQHPYGTTTADGSSSNGAIFAINTDGTGFTNLYNFTASTFVFGTNSDGAVPYGSLILVSNTLYGTASRGGSSGRGTVFAVETNGTGFTNLYSFTALVGPSNGTNSDGADPVAGLVLSGNTLYGTANDGGSSDSGTVFAINTDGTVFTNLHSFASFASYGGTNSDGANPGDGSLILSGNTLYGTAMWGGLGGVGTVFAINTDGTGFTNLHSFTFPRDPYVTGGANPNAGLILSGNILYGTAIVGGNFGGGTVFAVNTNGTGFTNGIISPYRLTHSRMPV